MVLDDGQNGLFFDVMDSLLYYVNDRFRVVEGFTLDYNSPLDDVKSSLVAHALWENVAIIDDFVKENPYHLPKRGLDLASSWKTALHGLYTLVRYQSGRALLMNEAGVFSVCGVTYALENEIGPAPAYVEMVLLPFEDCVVYDGFLQAYDTDRTPASIQRIQDEFENRCSQGIVSTGADFVKRVGQYLAEKRDKEFDDMLADMSRAMEHGEDQLPDGFHRGALAGLSPDERAQATHARRQQLVSAPSITARKFDKRVRRHEPVTSLAGCLSLMTKAQLDNIAQLMGMGSLSHLRKAEIVSELAAELPLSEQLLAARLVMAEDNDYAFAQRLSNEGRVDFALAERNDYAWIWPIEPYVYLFRGKDGYSAVVPEELKALLAAADFEAMDRVRRQHKQAINCVDACVVYCGVASVDDVYDQYRSLVSDVLDREDFERLIEFEVMTGSASFGTWDYVPQEYVVHYTLTPDYLAEEIANAHHEAIGGLMRNGETGELSIQHLMRNMRTDLASELEWLEQYKRDLVESQANLPMKPLSRSILENDVIGELLADDSVVRLRSYLDAHIPDGADDYLFADAMAEAVIMSAIETGSVQEAFGFAMNLGFGQSAEEEERLPLLITNVFNAMPSWENNGWSPQELYEQVTGRKVFYNDDGTIMKIGADDPCPCNSGKKYRDCCGR